jgi:hypothetical protein
MRRFTIVFSLITAALAVLAPAPALAQPGDRPLTQLFLAPTGRVLPKGAGYFKGVALASVPMMQAGVTDRFSIGAGTPLLALGEGFAVTPKFQVQRSRTHATAVGTVHFIASGSSEFGVGYVAHTVETDGGGAFHVAILAPYGHRGFYARPGLMLGAEHRLSARTTFITENYLLGDIPMLSAGVRVRGAHGTWDVGWMQAVAGGHTFGGPVLNVGWMF